MASRTGFCAAGSANKDRTSVLSRLPAAHQWDILCRLRSGVDPADIAKELGYTRDNIFDPLIRHGIPFSKPLPSSLGPMYCPNCRHQITTDYCVVCILRHDEIFLPVKSV